MDANRPMRRLGGSLRSALLVVAGAWLMFGATARAQLQTWDFVQDFQPSPNQANPSPDRYGNADVWSYLEGPTSAPNDPGQYTLWTDFAVAGPQQCWRSNNLEINTPDACLDTSTTPAHSDVDPASTRFAIVEWKSPVDGTVDVSGSVTDLDSSCGDGVTWMVNDGTTTLASGAIPNGGSQNFAAADGGSSLAAVTVSKGDSLYFLVGPGAGTDYFCDSTNLQVTITGAPLDGGSPDAGTPDAGTPDAGTPDAGTPDAGTPDAGTPDGGTCRGGGADLSVKVFAPRRARCDGEFLYWVVLHNNGPEDARSVTLTDELSPDVTLLGAETFPEGVDCHLDGTTATCFGPVMPAGSTFVGMMLVRANRSCGVPNTARVTSRTFDPNEDNNSRTVITHVGARDHDPK